MPTPEVAAWFRTALAAAQGDLTAHRRQQAATLAKRKSEVSAMQERLLNAYRTGTIDDEDHARKSLERQQEMAKLGERTAQTPQVGANDATRRCGSST